MITPIATQLMQTSATMSAGRTPGLPSAEPYVAVIDRYVEQLSQYLRAPDSSPIRRPIEWHTGSRIVLNEPVSLSFAGLTRIGDDEVTRTVRAYVAERREWASDMIFPVRVLELGAGTSYPGVCSDLGAPWLARSLKMEFGDSIELTVTDVRGGFTDLPDHLVLTTQGSRTQVEFAPVGCSAQPTPLVDKWGARFQGEWSADGERGQVVRPVLDPTFEACAFGISVRLGVDLFHPRESLLTGSFDIIYARHQIPAPRLNRLVATDVWALLRGRHWELISQRLASCLAPHGIAILHIDDPGAGTTRAIIQDDCVSLTHIPHCSEMPPEHVVRAL